MPGSALVAEILKRSVSTDWFSAVSEWFWIDTYYIDRTDIGETCLCGHFPIYECCVIENRYTSETAVVGNCCIKKFMDTDSDLIFQALNRISADDTRSVNPVTLDHALNKSVISEWEFNFYSNVLRKRVLSDRQQIKKAQINRKILRGFRGPVKTVCRETANLVGGF